MLSVSGYDYCQIWPARVSAVWRTALRADRMIFLSGHMKLELRFQPRGDGIDIIFIKISVCG